LRVALPPGIRLDKQDAHLLLRREAPDQAALHGMARSLMANAVQGVTRGFEKHLDIVGIGYRSEVKGKVVAFTLGYSHPIEFPIPEGITIRVDKLTHIVVGGADKQQVGQLAAEIRALRPPDPYKNKGIRYTGERLKKKVGKAAAAAGAAKAG
jgi:large subunit ribosomal protein L6